MYSRCFFLCMISLLLLSCDQTMDQLPVNIDHLVYTAPTLEQGIQEIETLLGVTPVRGGRHPNYGTHNALLSLGDNTYLEIIAPDPGLPPPEKGRLLEESYDKPPGLTTWVLRTTNLEILRTKAMNHGLMLGEIEAGERETPEGKLLSWQLTSPYALPMNGTVPFLIDWGETPHPAGSVPQAGELIGLQIEHPDPDKVIEYLQLLNVHVSVKQGPEPKITAHIRTDRGVVILR